jgi:hypothetical protein
MTETWNLNSLDNIGGHKTEKIGEPKLEKTSKGEAVIFDGIGNGLIVHSNPLRNAEAFTVEIIFNPAKSDNPNNVEQRFVHFQNLTNENSRILIELRLTKDNQWFLDTFIKSDDQALTLYAEKFPHPVDQWYHAALVYEKGLMKHFVNHVEEMSGNVAYVPIEEADTSLGMRINHVSWFNGAIKTLRVTDKALIPSEFLPM